MFKSLNFTSSFTSSFIVALLLNMSVSVAFAETSATAPEKNAAEKTVQTVCAACHGADGNSAIALNPKLAGQHPEYLLKQLINFKEGKRSNAVMAGMVANLTPDDMKGLAAYFAGQKQTLAKAKSNGAGSLGEKIYRGGIAATNVPACASCHGANTQAFLSSFLAWLANMQIMHWHNCALFAWVSVLTHQ